MTTTQVHDVNPELDVQLETDLEADAVHRLAQAHLAWFDLADRVLALVQIPPHVLGQVLWAQKQAIRDAHVALCRQVSDSRRRAELINLAQALADQGSDLVFDESLAPLVVSPGPEVALPGSGVVTAEQLPSQEEAIAWWRKRQAAKEAVLAQQELNRGYEAAVAAMPEPDAVPF
jgi:hypothetical protein